MNDENIDEHIFLVTGRQLKLAADCLRKMQILKTPDSIDALDTMGLLLGEIIQKPLEQKSDLKTPFDHSKD
jgi:hypothetical protein